MDVFVYIIRAKLNGIDGGHSNTKYFGIIRYIIYRGQQPFLQLISSNQMKKNQPNE